MIYYRDMPVSCGSFAYIAIVLFMTSALNLLGIAMLRYVFILKEMGFERGYKNHAYMVQYIN